MPLDLFVQPKNTMPRIESIWAFVSVDPIDGNEGVCAAPLTGVMLPMIAADKDRLEILIPMAEYIVAQTGIKIKLVKFTTREEVHEYGSQNP
jgi:hypothetical protein